MAHLIAYLFLSLIALFVVRHVYRDVRGILADTKLAAHVRHMQEQKTENRMSNEDFLALKNGLQADGWLYDPTFYRFTKPGRPDYLPDRAPMHWPTEPGDNPFLHSATRSAFLARYA